MAQRPYSDRAARQPERPVDGDITAIYDDRLSAFGINSNDFVAKRSSAEAGILPRIEPVRIGRGSAEWTARKLATAENEPAAEPEPAPQADADSQD